MKKCKSCKIEKNNEYFAPSEIKKKSAICRSCHTIAVKKYRNKYKDKIKKYNQKYYLKNKKNIKSQKILYDLQSLTRMCSKCKKIKSINDFYKSKINSTYAACKPCGKEISRQFRIRHGAKVDSKHIYKFNEIETINIINLYKNNMSCKEIGKLYNCSKQKINKLLTINNITIKDASHANRKYHINENIFSNIESPEQAYWLGILAGDGWIHYKKNTKNAILGLSLQEKDKEYMYKFRDFLESNHPIKIINNCQKKDGTASISYAIYINNKKIIEDLKKYEIKPNKTYHMTFPNIPDNLLSHYMLGLIDSDGCFCLKHKKSNNTDYLNFSFVGPPEFISAFQQKLIEKCNISKTKIQNCNSTVIKVISYGGYKNIYKIVKFLYSDANIFFKRKKEIPINYLLSKYPNDSWLLSQK